MYHTQQAARYIEAGEYIIAEERIKVAINDIKPYLPDTRRIMARTYCELMNRFDEAERWHRRAVDIRDAVASKAAKAHADPGPH